MKLISFYACAILLLAGCNDSSETDKEPENDVDAAGTFVRSALNGDYKKARKLIVEDSANVEWLNTVERSYLQANDATEQRNLREASIIVHDVKRPNDSTTIMIFSNSYKKKKDSVKTVRVNDQWKIDLKYTFQNNNEQAP